MNHWKVDGTCRDCGAIEVVQNGTARWYKEGVSAPYECLGYRSPPPPEMPPLQRDAVPMNRAEWKQLIEENKKLKEQFAAIRNGGRCACTWRDTSTPVTSVYDVKPCGAHMQWLEVAVAATVEERVKVFTEEHDRQCKDTGERLEIYRKDVILLKEQLAASEAKATELGKRANTYRAWYEDALRRVERFRLVVRRVKRLQGIVEKVLNE